MKPDLPSSHFQEQEIDFLIGAFGIEPSPENRREVLAMLREQKEQFDEIDRQRDARDARERNKER